MIPKIIHYCWLSGDPYPPIIRECLETWKECLGDYEIWLWDRERFDIASTAWTKEAFECKKYAFAADYIRLYALYNYGGIYLDSDVTVYKSFDDLLDRPYFIGEDYLHCFEPAIIGAEKGCEWIKTVLDYYENRHFFR
jgi:Mannosyltransferase OCH1 and related enzymes